MKNDQHLDLPDQLRSEHGLLARWLGGSRPLGAEQGVIVEFLREESGDWVAHGHRDCGAPDRLPDVRSWQYPGEWTTPVFEQLTEAFGERHQALLFSNSGSYNIGVEKVLFE